MFCFTIFSCSDRSSLFPEWINQNVGDPYLALGKPLRYGTWDSEQQGENIFYKNLSKMFLCNFYVLYLQTFFIKDESIVTNFTIMIIDRSKKYFRNGNFIGRFILKGFKTGVYITIETHIFAWGRGGKMKNIHPWFKIKINLGHYVMCRVRNSNEF